MSPDVHDDLSGFKVGGFGVVCPSRKERSGGGVVLLVREGLTYKEQPDLGIFEEGLFESVFVEIGVGEVGMT